MCYNRKEKKMFGTPVLKFNQKKRKKVYFNTKKNHFRNVDTYGVRQKINIKIRGNCLKVKCPELSTEILYSYCLKSLEKLLHLRKSKYEAF